MREAIRRAAPIVSTGLVGIVFLGAGVLIGAKRAAVEVISAPDLVRFQKLTDTTALDSKTGLTCALDVPSGVILDNGMKSCPDLAKQ